MFQDNVLKPNLWRSHDTAQQYVRWWRTEQQALTGEGGGPVQGVQEQVHPDEFAKYCPCNSLVGEEC